MPSDKLGDIVEKSGTNHRRYPCHHLSQLATAPPSYRPPIRREERSKLHYLALSSRPDVEFEAGAPAPLSASAQDSSALCAIEPAVWTDPEPPSDIFLALQRWEGVVIECREET